MSPLCVYTCAAIALVALCAAEDVRFYNSMSSSSYARVQYANNNNSVIRRLGVHRDPTIQYVNFDDLYNKHNVKPGYAYKTEMEKPKEIDRRKFDVNINEANDVTTTSKTLSWEEAPDLTNGWTIENQQEVTQPSVKASTNSNKGIDYVYAYSNVYNAYNEHDNFPKRSSVTKPKVTTPAPSRVNSYADGPGLGTAEYAHYSNIGDGGEAVTSSAAPPVVMEASWTDQQIKSTNNFATVKQVKPTQEAKRNPDLASVKRMPSTPPPPQSIKRKGNGVQSDWRPFSGPTSTVAPTTQQMMTPDETDETLFYADTQKNLRPTNEQRPEIPFENVPVFVMDREPDVNTPANVVFPSPTENEINRHDAPLASLQPSASISVSSNFNNDRQPSNFNNDRQPPNFQRFQPNGNRFERPMQHNLVIPSVVPPANDRPSMVFQQPNRPPPPAFQPQQPQPWNDRFNNNRFNNNNNGNRRPVAFGMRNPGQSMGRPEAPQVPSGPVGLPPQLQPNQGRPEQHLTIRLPLPKPGGGVGSSPQNPLPGPPIFLQSPANNNDRIDGPHTSNPLTPQFNDGQFNHIQGGLNGPPPPQFGPHPGANRFPQQPNFRPQPQFRPPNFFPPPPPTTTTATSLIKSFFSRIFPFAARSLDGQDVPFADDVTDGYNQTVTEQPLNLTTTTTATYHVTNSTTTP